MPEYTAAAVLAAAAVVLVEVRWLRTGLFRTRSYRLTMAVVFAFQCLVDGWLTKLDHPIVRYHPDAVTGVRVPWDIPVEDFAFGFALITLVLLRWESDGRRAHPAGAEHPASVGAVEGERVEA
jgi:lycopene cyclase domain-containing protein